MTLLVLSPYAPPPAVLSVFLSDDALGGVVSFLLEAMGGQGVKADYVRTYVQAVGQIRWAGWEEGGQSRWIVNATATGDDRSAGPCVLCRGRLRRRLAACRKRTGRRPGTWQRSGQGHAAVTGHGSGRPWDWPALVQGPCGSLVQGVRSRGALWP